MTTSRKLTSVALALFALVIMSVSALAADPGNPYPPTSEVSDQKAGSVLAYNFYTSSGTSSGSQNTKINITNTSSTSSAYVHLFFVDGGSSCSVADSFICLTPNQTASFLASDVDPNINGYIIAVAVDSDLGCPISFNFLIGDQYIKTETHAANLGAEAFAALYNGTVPGCDSNSFTAALNFNGNVGSGYNRAPRVLALSNIPSRVDGNDTLLIVNRFSGNLATGAATLGSIFALLYDDAENVFSANVTGLPCQWRVNLSNTTPRFAPRFETVIPSGRTGWMKIWNASSDVAIIGAMINAHPEANASPAAFNGGHNLHKLTLTTTAVYTMPIFPPSC